jgi:hypothetical protein
MTALHITSPDNREHKTPPNPHPFRPHSVNRNVPVGPTPRSLIYVIRIGNFTDKATSISLYDENHRTGQQTGLHRQQFRNLLATRIIPSLPRRLTVAPAREATLGHALRPSG